MPNTYQHLIQQTYSFPQESFRLERDSLCFNGVSIHNLIKKYGTPLRLMYLPKISVQIQQARNWFHDAISKYNYQGSYEYAYCTKSNHFVHVVEEALSNGVHLETSSVIDIELIISLLARNKISQDIHIIHNGFKTDNYLKAIVQLQDLGFKQSIVVLDNRDELHRLLRFLGKGKMKIGIRMAINEEAKSPFNESRLGIIPEKILPFYESQIKNNPQVQLEMLHFFVDSGIKDTMYYWGEFQKALDIYIALKQQSTSLKAFNIGGGFPIRNQLRLEYDYMHMVDAIVKNIHQDCTEASITEPNIYTEFGKYTVGESGATIFQVIAQKQQNDAERWYIIDNSLINTIPDAWFIHEKFILLPINKWNQPYHRVNIGGISCDHLDYYNTEDLDQAILLPKFKATDKEPLYIGFFHTGAYQDAISGYGGITHCLIPSPQHVVVTQDATGQIIDYLYRPEQKGSDITDILGY